MGIAPGGIGRCIIGFAIACAALGPTTARGDLNLPDPDVTPPTVEIVDPVDGFQLEAPDIAIQVVVEAEDLPGLRSDVTSGISMVWIDVDGSPSAMLTEPPYTFEVTPTAPGMVVLRAHATDYEGNTGDSEIVTIFVGGGGTSSGSSGGAPSGDSSSSGAPTTDGPPVGEGGSPSDGGSQGEQSSDRGCACNGGRAIAPTWALVVLLAVRRRGRARPAR